MRTHIFQLIPLIAICFISCSDSTNSGKNSNDQRPPQSEGPLPLIDLPELPSSHVPRGLAAKIVVSDGKVFVPMDFQTQQVNFIFDLAQRQAKAGSVLFFRMPFAGRPYFQLKASLLSAKLNGAPVSFSTISDPDHLNNSYMAFDHELPEGSFAFLELEFSLPGSSLDWSDDGIGFLTDMTDLSPGRFSESWWPANFEDDPFLMNLKIEITGAATSHQLFTNGSAFQTGQQQWNISFPSSFTTSSFYVHLTRRPLLIKNFSIAGQEKAIPVTVYSSQEKLLNEAVTKLPAFFTELEKDYGPYPHQKFIAYVHGGSGGMEYSGATITSLGALGHEVFHSWFARGVLPAEGRSGWIDEAMASWRDNHYFQATSLLGRAPTVLASFSPFRQSTPSNCYKDGRHLLAELDFYFQEFGGMKVLMKGFFQRYRHRVITTEEFEAFLGDATGKNPSPFFRRYAFGEGTAVSFENIQLKPVEAAQEATGESGHPSALTADELRDLR